MQKVFKYLVIILVISPFISHKVLAQDIDGQAIFRQQCSSCHSIGRGRMVGPDLMNIHEKRSHDWLIRFIVNSGELIASGDKDAVAIFNEYNQMPMPPFQHLSGEEIDAIIAYMETASLEASSARETEVTTLAAATPAFRPLSPNDFEFRLVYWISVGVILLLVYIGGWMIARFSK